MRKFYFGDFFVVALSAFVVIIWVITKYTQQTPPPLTLEVAYTEAEKAKGLGGRESMPEDHAMLFRWDSPGKYCLWGKDMKFDLDTAFLDDSGKIIAAYPIKAGSTEPVCSPTPVRLALEMNSGILKRYF